MTDQTEDQEFAEFLEIARKPIEQMSDEEGDRLTLSLIKHPEWLKDQTKTDQFFPPVADPAARQLGKEDVTCLSNLSLVLGYSRQRSINTDGKVPPVPREIIHDFMHIQHSTTGENIATLAAKNAQAVVAQSPLNEDIQVTARSDQFKPYNKLLYMVDKLAPDLKLAEDGNGHNVLSFPPAKGTEFFNQRILKVSEAEVNSDASSHTSNPTATMDEEFAEFLEIARKETLTDDDTKKLQDTLRAHPQWLRDPTKTDQFFPQPVMKRDKDGNLEEMTRSEACGLEKTDCMRNVINTVVALNEEQGPDGKPILSDEAFHDFMGTTDSKTGRNFATVTARNLKANEFKSAKAKSPALKAVLDSNHESLLQTLQTIQAAQPELMDTRDGNAVKATKYVNEEQLNVTPEQELNVTQEQPSGTYSVGGTTANTPKDLNVKPEEEDNIADVQPAEEEDQGKGDKLKFDRVKEQDIIDYMFNEWFLASINYIMEKVYGWADSFIDWMTAKHSPSPKVQASGQKQKKKQGQQQGQENQQTQQGPTPRGGAATMLRNISDTINDITFNDREVSNRCNLLLQDIRNNIDKDPKDWQTQALDPIKHADFIKTCIQKHRQNPEEFQAMLDNKAKLLSTVMPAFVSEIKMATTLAVLEYASNSKNLGKPIDEEARVAIEGRTKMLLKDMAQTRNILTQKYENEYRLAHHLEPEAQLDEAAQQEISQKVATDYREQLDGIASKALTTEKALSDFYDDSSADKAVTGAGVKKAREEMLSAMQQLGNVPADDQTQTRINNRDNGPTTLDQEAERTNQAENYERRVNERIERDQNARDADRETSNQRRREYDQHSQQGNTNSQTGQQHRFDHTTGDRGGRR